MHLQAQKHSTGSHQHLSIHRARRKEILHLLECGSLKVARLSAAALSLCGAEEKIRFLKGKYSNSVPLQGADWVLSECQRLE